MIYSNQYGKVDFWNIPAITEDPELSQTKKVAVTLSGGVDSSFVMFMLCEKIKELKLDLQVLPFTGVDKLRPTNEWNAREIALLFKEMYPEVNFMDHYVFKYDHEPNNTSMKRKQHVIHERKLYAEQDIKLWLCGKSANPPIEEVGEKSFLVKDREVERDTSLGDQYKIFTRIQRDGVYNRWLYRPLAFMHKKFMAEEYKKHNLMEELFPLTASCIGYAEKTNHFSGPCKVCWWCKEKKWAFGMYDGGEVHG